MKTTLRDGDYAVARSRPAFEKLAIGPAMVFGEAIAGGHYMDILRFRKQMFVGRYGAPSYWRLHKLSVSETGYVGAFIEDFFLGACYSATVRQRHSTTLYPKRVDVSVTKTSGMVRVQC